MLIQYDVPKIDRVLNDFFTATGTRIDLFDNTFSAISSSQHEICSYCRKIQQDPLCKGSCNAFDRRLLEKTRRSQQAQQDYCPFGLLNMVAPIFYNGNILGYLFFGQMKTADSLHRTQLQEDFDRLKPISLAQSQSIANLAQILIGHILTENMLKPDSREVVAKAVAFIQNDLQQDLSIKRIAEGINASKSVLYKKFREHLHCTVGEYINKKRIEQARRLLLSTDLSMEEISRQCGFSSASYFTKTFKQHTGITPLKFKRSRQ